MSALGDQHNRRERPTKDLFINNKSMSEKSKLKPIIKIELIRKRAQKKCGIIKKNKKRKVSSKWMPGSLHC